MVNRVLWKVFGNRFGAVVVGLGLIAIATLVWGTGEVKCGDRVMEPGDSCTTVRKGTSTERSYEEQKSFDAKYRWVLTAIGGAVAVGGVVMIVKRLVQPKNGHGPEYDDRPPNPYGGQPDQHAAPHQATGWDSVQLGQQPAYQLPQPQMPQQFSPPQQASPSQQSSPQQQFSPQQSFGVPPQSFGVRPQSPPPHGSQHGFPPAQPQWGAAPHPQPQWGELQQPPGQWGAAPNLPQAQHQSFPPQQSYQVPQPQHPGNQQPPVPGQLSFQAQHPAQPHVPRPRNPYPDDNEGPPPRHG